MRCPTLPRGITLPALAALLLLAPRAGGVASAASVSLDSSGDKRWIHVRVQEMGEDHETVRLNLPLSLLEAILPLIHDDDLKDGRVRLGRGTHLRLNNDDLDAVQLRAIWSEVRTAKDGEYITVEGKHDDVRVAKQGAMLIVKSAEPNGDRVEMTVPITVMDALFSGKSDELDLMAAVRALADHGDVQLVAVDEDSSMVRIWVDAKNVSD